MNDKGNTTWQSLLDKITFEASDDLLAEIKKVSNLSTKIEICYNTPNIQKALSDWLSTCLNRPSRLKDVERSVRYRLGGNSFCEEGKYGEALKLYTKALLYSPHDSEEQRSAYANRSHVLLLTHQFEDSIKDIDRALDNDTSVLRQIKLSVRKGECFLALEKYSEALKIFNKTTTKINALDKQLKKKTLKTLQQLQKLIEVANNEMKNGSYKGSNRKLSEPLKSQLPNLDFTENPEFRFASKRIALRKNEQKGRYVVANEDIRVGDVLFMEKPFAFVVLPEMVHKYCTFCCSRIFAPVPCSTCVEACFCNEECRERATESFHRWECRGMELCFSVGIAHLSLRVALLGLNDQNDNKYTEIKNLLSHLDNIQPPDLFSYTVTATLFTIYLENYSDLFKADTSKVKLFEFGGRLLLHVGQLVCNGHAITDIETEELGSREEGLLLDDQVRVATAIYPSASMMNHSCRPNIINSFHNSLLIVRATQDLKKGDEVFNCYGPIVYNTEYKKRQELLLSQYLFACDCTACRNKEEPVRDTLLCRHCSFKLTPDSNSCSNCSKLIDMETLIKDLKESDLAFERGLDESEKGHFEEQCKHFQRALKLREKHCHKYHRKLLECRDQLARTYAALGKEEDTYNLIVKNMEAIEEIYGQFSIELGQEIIKLVTVASSLCDRTEKLSQKQRNILNKCLEHGNKGLLIFTLSYGEWHPRYFEMKKHVDYIHFFLQL